MKKHLIPSLFLLFGVLTACQEEQVTPTPPSAPARTVQEAQARLTTQSKWVIDEALVDGELIFKRNQTDPQEADIEVEWCRFHSNGQFEVKTLGDPTTDILFYKLDGPSNQLIISEDQDFTRSENWTVKTGSVYADKFNIEQQGDEALLLKMVPAP